MCSHRRRRQSVRETGVGEIEDEDYDSDGASDGAELDDDARKPGVKHAHDNHEGYETAGAVRQRTSIVRKPPTPDATTHTATETRAHSPDPSAPKAERSRARLHMSPQATGPGRPKPMDRRPRRR